MTFSVTKNGQPLDPDKYTWDEENKVFSTYESFLVLDFIDYFNVTFNTGHYCIFNTGHSCTFNTKYNCTFNTGPYCIFHTGSYCIFNTDYKCTFNTEYCCMFNVYYSCKFKVGKECVIKRRDVFEFFSPPDNKLIQLNEWKIPGFLTEEEILMKEIIE